jgi:tRNA uracil 4-sulfurtransferase
MKLIALMSGGIDSPVAVHLMLKKGAEIVALHMDNRPLTDVNTLNKTLRLIDRLEALSGKPIKRYIAPHGQNQLTFAQNCRHNMQCVLCRRMMYRVAELVAIEEGADGILTGESLGQVASQTLPNLRAENETVSIPIIRPLIGLDKLEIEAIAKDIGTFDISIEPGGCCSITPDHPATAATPERVIDEEKRIGLDILGQLAEKTWKEAEVTTGAGPGDAENHTDEVEDS